MISRRQGDICLLIYRSRHRQGRISYQLILHIDDSLNALRLFWGMMLEKFAAHRPPGA